MALGQILERISSDDRELTSLNLRYGPWLGKCLHVGCALERYRRPSSVISFAVRKKIQRIMQESIYSLLTDAQNLDRFARKQFFNYYLQIEEKDNAQ
jgi:hypothetical protein